MHIVLYRSEHCPACRKLSAQLLHLCRKLDAHAEVKDVLEHLEEASAQGVTHPPAVVVNGRLLGQGAVALAKLKQRTAP